MRIVRPLVDGLLLRCPNCHTGRMFDSYFHMRPLCPVCGLEFERASGEITGGMGVSIVAALFLSIVAAAIIGFSSVPVLPTLLLCGFGIIVFVIAFYPVSRGIWVGFLYLIGSHEETD